MKKIYNYIAIALAATAMASCSSDQLETAPTTSVSGSTMTTSSDAAMISLNGVYRSMYTSGWSTTGNTHQCFGISAYSLCADVMGDDCIMNDQGSGWFWFDCLYNVKSRYTLSTWRSYDLWYAFYTWIANANYLIAMDKSLDPADLDKKYVLGQAYAVRAYSYFMVAQYFARTYAGHENEPCAPIYTEPTSAGTEGQPRSTVKQVYDLIVADINKSVDYLTDSQKASLVSSNKSYINLGVALGLKARIALTMEDWQTAADAAEAAIKLNKYSIEAVNANDFVENGSNFINDVSKKNVMWGAQIITDQVGMYASLYTHMDADLGKYGATARKQINKDTYAFMGAKDTRRCWWNPTDANNGDNGYQQEKFKFRNQSTWLGDYVWMRIEEMYLIAAEAECMLGGSHEDVARKYLVDMVKTRDSEYTCSKTGTALGALTSDKTGSLREEIINQRRIELWGEYGRVYDIRRLKQGFVRTTAQGWPASACLKSRPTDDPENYMWVLSIPQDEFDGNINMDDKKDQNPLSDK